MRKLKCSIAIFAIMILLSGCIISDETFFGDNSTETSSEINTIETITIKDKAYNDTPSDEKAASYMFMLEDKLFVDTGEIEYGITCGTMDRGFESVIPLEETPDQNGEANFTSEYKGAQFGRRENRMVSYVDGEWHIFACNENSYDGVSMKVIEASPAKLTLELSNHIRKDLIYGEYFTIEYYDSETSQWLPVDKIVENGAFPELAYLLKAADTSTVEVDFEWLYGTLNPGKYRIIKDIIDSYESGNYDKYWYMAKFEI